MKHTKNIITDKFEFDNEIDRDGSKKVKIPANVDPIKLADEIKGDMAAEWLKRRDKIKSRPLLVQ